MVRIQTIHGHRKSLIITFYTVTGWFGSNAYTTNALVDTGCEINLIKTGLLPKEFFTYSKSQIRLVTANGSQLGGGTRETTINLITNGYLHTPMGYSVDHHSNLEFPTTFFEAQIACDAILSFKWLAGFDVDIKSKLHGLQLNHGLKTFFIPGSDDGPAPDLSSSNKIRMVAPNIFEVQVGTRKVTHIILGKVSNNMKVALGKELENGNTFVKPVIDDILKSYFYPNC